MTSALVCVDCPPGLNRPAKRPGPRCATHTRAHRKMLSARTWERHTIARYKMTAAQYWALYEAQGGRCAICQRASGRSKRLSVDHDHTCCSSVPTCGGCTRGLLCTTCNNLLGHLRDSLEAVSRVGSYLCGELPGQEGLTWVTRNRSPRK